MVPKDNPSDQEFEASAGSHPIAIALLQGQWCVGLLTESKVWRDQHKVCFPSMWQIAFDVAVDSKELKTQLLNNKNKNIIIIIIKIKRRRRVLPV